MLRVLTALCLCLSLALLAGCGGSKCDDACDKYQECIPNATCSVSGTCDAKAECVSDCITSHSCAEITDLMNPQNPYLQCVAKCN